MKIATKGMLNYREIQKMKNEVKLQNVTVRTECAGEALNKGPKCKNQSETKNFKQEFVQHGYITIALQG